MENDQKTHVRRIVLVGMVNLPLVLVVVSLIGEVDLTANTLMRFLLYFSLILCACAFLLLLKRPNRKKQTESLTDELANPIVVDFPLRGEWFAPNTPAKQIPSHGTDMLGQRYAFDFVMAKWSGSEISLFRGSSWRYYVLGMPLSSWYGWGQNVYAPCDGKIIKVRDGLKERQRVHLIVDFLIAIKNGLFFRPNKHDLRSVAGNHIILQTDHVYAALAHFQNGSICVSEGQHVRAGELLGRVGHSGNSTAPHLHFQLMDGPDWLTARGVPCGFEHYERFTPRGWERVVQGIPSDQDRIRRLDSL